METIHADGSLLAAYLEGEGTYDPDFDARDDPDGQSATSDVEGATCGPSFAPSSTVTPYPRLRTADLPPIHTSAVPPSAISRLHHAWSSAINSRLRRADNTKFLEHFRYILVASQLLNEYLDQGALQPGTVPCGGLEGSPERSRSQTVSMSVYGAVVTAAAAFALVYILHWVRPKRNGDVRRSQVVLVVIGFLLVAIVGYACLRRQWLKFLRGQAVGTASGLTTNWQAFELSTGSSLSFIQEVELVSKGYKISTPMPPISRIEDNAGVRRCARLRRGLHKAYAATIPACIDACAALRPLIDIDDLERYYDVYDISLQDAREALGSGALGVLEDDPESLKSLRVLSYRSGVLRRITLCSLMALEADGGTPDFQRWRVATTSMARLSQVLASSAERVRQILGETETLHVPSTPSSTTGPAAPNAPARERFRNQVRKISMLSSGIRGLQAKMQILREETNHSLAAATATDDLVDLGPNLLAQYDAIGHDLRELMAAWETGRASLQHNITRHGARRSLASLSSSSAIYGAGGLLSPAPSLSGRTAVDDSTTDPGSATSSTSPNEDLDPQHGGGGKKSHRSSLPATASSTPADDEPLPGQTLVYEALALPRQRARSTTLAGNPPLSREERIARAHEERERQALLRARRDANTSMLRELESVINLRPRKGVETAAAGGIAATTATTTTATMTATA